MKIRTSFVSNSSSSSFVAVGQNTDLQYILSWCGTPEQWEEENIYAAGGYLYEARDFFPISYEILRYIQSLPRRIRYNLEELGFFKVFQLGDYDLTVNTQNLPDGVTEFQVFSGEIDYSSTRTLKEFNDRYIEKTEEVYF